MKLLLCFRSEKEKKGKGKDEEVGDVRANRKDTGADPASSAGPKEESDNRSQLPTFTLQELAAATKDFSHECLIGQGGFGDVYKGTLERNGQVVAIKKLNQSGLQGNQEFLVEVLMLSLLRHPNLVTLCGFCAEEKQRMLVYEYMPLGSLHDHLHDPGPDKEPLDWNTRIKIAAGAAEGLEFLHHKAEPAVIYRDLKASNILLGEGFHPKLSDFGLAKFGPSGDKSHVSTRVMGTRGYCAPEYAESGKLTTKSDIYSFGVVLLELITGRRALDVRRVHDRQLLQWASPMLKDRSKYLQLADPLLRGQFPESVFKKTVDIAILCLQGNANNRPSMQEVVAAMEYLKSRKYCPEKVGDVDTKSTGNNSPDQTKTPDSEQAVTEARMSREPRREKQQQRSNDPDG